MKKTIALFTVSLLSTGAFADNFSGNPDLKTSPLNDHGGGALASAAQRGEGDFYGSVLLDRRNRDSAGGDIAVAKGASAQLGEGDSYGSVLLDTRRDD